MDFMDFFLHFGPHPKKHYTLVITSDFSDFTKKYEQIQINTFKLFILTKYKKFKTLKDVPDFS